MVSAVAINHHQAGVWFSLGCAAMRIDNYEIVTEAFRRKLEIDSDDFEGWNNLGNGYLKLGKKRRALLAFHVSSFCYALLLLNLFEGPIASPFPLGCRSHSHPLVCLLTKLRQLAPIYGLQTGRACTQISCIS